MDGLKDKTFLIIGGASGIGAAVKEKLEEEAANALSTSRSEKGHLFLDVTGDLRPFTEQLPDVIHGLVYCPGTINLKPFSRLTDEDFKNDFEINVLGAVRVIREILPALKRAASASIVLYSSVATTAGMSFHASVAASKRALEGLAISLAAELAPHQIRVNVVAPSLTDTRLAANLLSSAEKKDAAAKRHPLGRYGTTNDMASATLFLLSAESSWITGQIMHVDGGLSSIKAL